MKLLLVLVALFFCDTALTKDFNDVIKMSGDLVQVLKDAKLEPQVNLESGKVESFKVISVKEGSAWEKLGFKEGDVVKALDGQSAMSTEEAMELYQQAKAEEQSEE